jgi:hypothetical protein
MMKLRVDFSRLYENVSKMGAVPREDFNVKVIFDPLDEGLFQGVEIALSDVASNTEGLLDYHGRQVLLYIPDQGRNILEVIDNPEKGRRFHVMDCKTLKNMRAQKRFDRYIVTNNMSGIFKISGVDQFTGVVKEAEAPLKICQNCLKALNYKGFATTTRENKMKIFNEFDLKEFFETYSTCFPHLPKNFKKQYDINYTEDWEQISREYRKKKNFTCETCHTNFGTHKHLLSTHHINGIKSDNHFENLKAVCLDCHRKEPFHDHMFISRKDMETIYKLRDEQGLSSVNSWEEAFKLADKAVHGVLKALQAKRKICPKYVGRPIKCNNEVVYLDLVWPDHKYAVSISENAKKANCFAWQIHRGIEILQSIL